MPYFWQLAINPKLARIEESHGMPIMEHEMTVKQYLKGFRTLEFHLVEKRTKNKCSCIFSIPKCLCRKRIHTTERIIGFWPKQMSKGNLNKTEKNQDQNQNQHSMKAYNLGDHFQQKIKSPLSDSMFIIREILLNNTKI